jgi:hypothetical protein
MSGIVNKFALISLVSLFLFAGSAQAQRTITTSSKSTVSSRMFLMNTADRKFMLELTLIQDTAVSDKWKPQLNIYSYGKSLQYLSARSAAPALEGNQVRFFADGRELKVESHNYFYMREAGRNGAQISFQSFQPVLNGGKILDEGGREVGGVLGEVINNDLTFDALPALNQAKVWEVKIGAESFTATGEQLAQLKELVKDAR